MHLRSGRSCRTRPNRGNQVTIKLNANTYMISGPYLNAVARAKVAADKIIAFGGEDEMLRDDLENAVTELTLAYADMIKVSSQVTVGEAEQAIAIVAAHHKSQLETTVAQVGSIFAEELMASHKARSQALWMWLLIPMAVTGLIIGVTIIFAARENRARPDLIPPPPPACISPRDSAPPAEVNKYHDCLAKGGIALVPQMSK